MGAMVSGQVVLRDSRIAAVTKGNYSGVVISLAPLDGPADPEPRRARMLQKDKTFTPHVLAISTGSVVDLPNLDPIFHSAFSSYSGQIFDVGLYPPGTNRAVRFTRPGVVRVFCNIHPTMSAVIVANRVTVVLNGQTVHSNAVIEGITGGALDNDELTPGPLLIQGDHTGVTFRKIVVTPIR